MGKKIWVAIHGVGDAKPGAILEALTKQASLNGPTSYHRQDVYLNGVHYPAALSHDSDSPDLYEVNWADVRQPSRSAIGVIQHIFSVLLSLLSIAGKWHFGAAEPQKITVRIFLFLIKHVAVWSLIYTLYARQYYLQDSFWPNAGLTLIVTMLFWGAGRLLRKQSSGYMNAGYFWAAVTLLTYLADFLPNVENTDLVRFSTFQYGFSAHLLEIALLASVVQIMFSKQAFWQKMTRCLALCLPITTLAVAAAFIWAINPEWIADSADEERWIAQDAYQIQIERWERIPDDQDAAQRVIDYKEKIAQLTKDRENMKKLEATQRRALAAVKFHPTGGLALITLGMGILGALTFIVIVAYVVAWLQGKMAGRTARHLFKWCIGVGLPIMVVLVVVVAMIEEYLYLHLWYPPQQSLQQPLQYFLDDLPWDPWDAGLFNRLGVMIFASLVPVGTVVSDILGDIVFWADQEKAMAPDNVRSELRTRFTSLIQHLLSTEPDATIAVISHSQGTVVAVDQLQTLADNDLQRIQLITMGSPLHSLYKPFFGLYDNTEPNGLLNDKLENLMQWNNIYRKGDYIGGEIDYPNCLNDCIGRGGHTHYWTDARVQIVKILRIDGT